MTFEDLDLIEPIRKALVQEGYTTPTPIQSEAIPIVSQGYDLLGCAQTGTGKTAAFSIPIIQRLYLQKKKGYKRGIKALILTPTRELAIQIGESFAAYGRFAGLRHTVIFGGVGQKPQTEGGAPKREGTYQNGAPKGDRPQGQRPKRHRPRKRSGGQPGQGDKPQNGGASKTGE